MSIFFQHIFSSGKSKFALGRSRGFTLIELLVVSAIIVIITMVLLLRQSRFDSSTILRSLAYSVALSVRQTQVYGTSVLGSNNSGAVSYASAYGLYFSAATPSSYVLFADFNNNGVYDSTEETVKVFSLNTGYVISEVCTKLSGGSNRCTGADDSSGMRTITSLNILFKRPNPDAVFTTDINGESYISGYIQVRSGDGTTRSVVITSPGQISVQAPGTLP
ncbi:MAG: type II secretion system protein [Candidatus Adlerbacteria bacterium]